MANNIRKINKQIASFVLLSAALALPTVSSSAATNDLIADASITVTPQAATQSAMMFYAAPSVPTETVNIRPDVQPIDTPMMFYASPSVPINIKPEVTPVQPPMVFYASPSVPTIQVETVKMDPSSVVKQVSPNVVEQNMMSNIKQNVPQASAVNAVNDINPNPNTRTEDFVNSEYGRVKIVEPYVHFVFK